MVAQPIKKLPALYRTRNFITVLTRVRHYTILSKLNPVSILISYFFKIRFNIILPAEARSVL